MNQDDFHESSVMVVLAGNFMLIFLLFWIILPVVENSGIWCLFIIFILFDTGFSFKNIHDSQQGKGETISLTPLYHFHPSHRHLDISQVITADN